MYSRVFLKKRWAWRDVLKKKKKAGTLQISKGHAVHVEKNSHISDEDRGNTDCKKLMEPYKKKTI